MTEIVNNSRIKTILNNTINSILLKARTDYRNKPIGRVGVQDNSIISFGSIHPDFPDWKEEIKWLADALH